MNCADRGCVLLSSSRSDEIPPTRESWSCGFEGCDRVYYSERGIRRHYILKHRHKFRRGRQPDYIHDDMEYNRLKIRLRRGQRHRQCREGSDEGDRRDEGDNGAGMPAAAVRHPDPVVRSQHVSGRSQCSSEPASGRVIPRAL